MIKKGTGAIINPVDPRDVPYARIARSTVIPDSHITDISHLPVEDQGRLGTCVGQAEGKVIEYMDYLETGVVTRISNRYIYGESKKRDGLRAGIQGTNPRVAAGVLRKQGTPREVLLPDVNTLSHTEYLNYRASDAINRDAGVRKTGGYAFVAPTAQEMARAIYENGVATVTLPVGDWAEEVVRPEPFTGEYHRVLIYGYSKHNGDYTFFFRNSWGKRWGGKGDGAFSYKDYTGKIYDVQVYTDIPNVVLEEYKEKAKPEYIITRSLDKGDWNEQVKTLQKRLNQLGYILAETGAGSPGNETSYYGNLTEKAVKRFQCGQGIICWGTPWLTGYGRVGPRTRKALNSAKKKA
jgi:hypothetical protein